MCFVGCILWEVPGTYSGGYPGKYSVVYPGDTLEGTRVHTWGGTRVYTLACTRVHLTFWLLENKTALIRRFKGVITIAGYLLSGVPGYVLWRIPGTLVHTLGGARVHARVEPTQPGLVPGYRRVYTSYRCSRKYNPRLGSDVNITCTLYLRSEWYDTSHTSSCARLMAA